MPVNMDPKKRRTFSEHEQISDKEKSEDQTIPSQQIDQESDKDRERELADAEAINLIGSDQGYG